MEGQDHFYGRVGLFLWKGRTVFMEGQGCFYGRAGPFLWKGRTIFMEGQGGSKFDLAIQKLLIPGMFMTHIFRTYG